MKKLLLAILVMFNVCSLTYAQEFSLDELVKLRTNTYPAFETYVHDKGYNLDHLEYNESGSVFRNGSNVISFTRAYDNGYSYHNHAAIKFETDSKELYEKLKRAVEAGMTYHKTRFHRTSGTHYVEHIYVDDKVVVHLYDIAYKDDAKPYYEIEIMSIYAGYDGYSRWER